ncbi:hypothetical protein GJ496_000893, partial [Pomphorhynchus laevis]
PKNRDIQRRVNEKQSLRSALVEERSQLCSFANYLRPYLEMQVSISDELCLMNELLQALDRQTNNSDVLQSELEECIGTKLSVNGEYTSGRQTARRVNRKPTSAIESLARCTRLGSKQRRGLSPSLSSLFSLVSHHNKPNCNNRVVNCSEIQSSNNSFQYTTNSPKSGIYNLSRDSGFTSQDHFYSSSSKTAYSLCLTKPTTMSSCSNPSIKAIYRKLTDGELLKGGHSRRPLLNSRLFYPPIKITKKTDNSLDSFDSNDHTIVKSHTSSCSSNQDSFLTLPLPPSTFFEDAKTSGSDEDQCNDETEDVVMKNDVDAIYESSSKPNPPPLPPRLVTDTLRGRQTFTKRNALLDEIERGVQLKKVAHHPRLS